jgi:hypothetical protein
LVLLHAAGEFARPHGREVSTDRPGWGQSRETIMQRLRCHSRFISRWSSRFSAERLAGLYARHPWTNYRASARKPLGAGSEPDA